MSLFKPDLWFPESVDYAVQLLTRPVWLADYISATLIATIFVAIQCIAFVYAIREYLQTRRSPARDLGPRGKMKALSWVSCAACAITILYVASIIIYWVVFGQRYQSVATLRGFTMTKEETLEWFRANPVHDGVKMICIPGSVSPEGPEFCTTFKQTDNLLKSKMLEITFASLVEAVILLADIVLVYRSYVIFKDMSWVYSIAITLFVISLAGPIMGIIALARIGSMGAQTDPWFDANFPTSGPLRFLSWDSPLLVISTSVAVNVFVTTAIISHLILKRRKVKGLLGAKPADIYLGISAMLVESAFPSAFCGVLAALFPKVGGPGKYTDRHGSLDMINLSPRILWYSFTALAPLLILTRVIQGRAYHNQQMGDTTPFSSAGRGLLFSPLSDTHTNMEGTH